jgi:hypothetical protein
LANPLGYFDPTQVTNKKKSFVTLTPCSTEKSVKISSSAPWENRL